MTGNGYVGDPRADDAFVKCCCKQGGTKERVGGDEVMPRPSGRSLRGSGSQTVLPSDSSNWLL